MAEISNSIPLVAEGLQDAANPLVAVGIARDGERAVVELGVAGFDGLRLHPAFVGDARETCFQRGFYLN